MSTAKAITPRMKIRRKATRAATAPRRGGWREATTGTGCSPLLGASGTGYYSWRMTTVVVSVLPPRNSCLGSQLTLSVLMVTVTEIWSPVTAVLRSVLLLPLTAMTGVSAPLIVVLVSVWVTAVWTDEVVLPLRTAARAPLRAALLRSSMAII